MTTTVKIHVNGDYVATVKHKVDGEEQPDTIVTGGSERTLYFAHGKTNEFTVTEQSKADFEKDAGDAGVEQAAHENANDTNTGE